MNLEVVESSVIGKAEAPDTCEDVVCVTPTFVAIFDGATSKSGARYNGLTGGRFAALALADALWSLPADGTARDAIDVLTHNLASAVGASVMSGAGADLPSSTALILSCRRREVWVVGDGWVRIGRTARRFSSELDGVASAFRAAVIEALLRGGSTVEELRHRDVGRGAILPLLKRQYLFRNQPSSARYAFGAIDGTAVPVSQLHVLPVPRATREITLASDGYPRLGRTLAESERHLAKMLSRDPLMFRDAPQTKGLQHNAGSFDDRAFVRVHLRAEAAAT
jgi:hypothetical protein